MNLALARQVVPPILFQHHHVALHPVRLPGHSSTLVTTYRLQSAHPSCHGSNPSPGYTQSLVGQENKARNEETRKDHTTAPTNKGRAHDNSNKQHQLYKIISRVDPGHGENLTAGSGQRHHRRRRLNCYELYVVD